jgi:Fe-S-cluster containining protein
MTEQRDLPAGVFSSWLRRVRIAQLDDRGVAVPCGGCTACCRSSYFVHIGRDEAQTLARIPGELLFAAPDLPKGNVLLGYDEQGRCPMLREDACSIYGDRPLTCRNYDCRVYTAAGIDADRALVTERARRWAFSYPTEDDRDQHAAVQSAARFLREHAECFPGGAVPGDPAQVAVLAVKVYEVFLDYGDGSGGAGRASADRVTARAVMEVNEEFEAGRDAPKAQPS